MLAGCHHIATEDAVAANKEILLEVVVVAEEMVLTFGEGTGIVAEDGEVDQENQVGQVMDILLGQFDYPHDELAHGGSNCKGDIIGGTIGAYLYILAYLLKQGHESEKVEVEMSPVITDAHDHVVDHEVDITDDVVGLLGR